MINMEKELDLEKCKSIHREMWEYVNKQKDNYDGLARGISKRRFCEKNKLNLFNHCALCEYARHQCCKNNKNVVPSGKYLCKYCPALWGTEDKVDNYYCECGIYDEDYEGSDEELNWVISKCDDIINIKWKDEVG